MGSMIVEMDARMAAYEDFEVGANANPYPNQSAAWLFYEDEYHTLTNNNLEGVLNGPN
jgi:hypothetical protein